MKSKFATVFTSLSIIIFLFCTGLAFLGFFRYLDNFEMQGSGMEIFAIILLDGLAILSCLILNIISLIAIRVKYNKTNMFSKSQVISCVLMIVIPIISFAIKLIIMNLL